MTAQDRGPGVYFDGASAAPQPVTLALEQTAVAIAAPDGAPLARWDYAAIEQLPSSQDRLRLALSDDFSTARLDVRDPAFAEAVRQHLGFGTPQHQARERRRRRLAVVWSAGAVAALITIGIAGLPTLAELLAPLVPPAREARIGAALHQATLASYAVKEGPVECGDLGDQERAGKAAFQKLFQQFESAANLPIPVRVHIIRSASINASAIPGGILHFNLGMIRLSQSPEEFGSVIGHEFGHLAHRHSLKRHLHNLGLAYLVALTLGDIFTGGSVVLASSGVFETRYSRANEREADAYGVRLMTLLGADTHAGAVLWDRVADVQKKFEANPILYDTHPASTERAAAIRATPKVANPKPLLTAEEWKALTQVCSGQ